MPVGPLISSETKREFRMQKLQRVLGPQLFTLARTKLRGKSFYPESFHELKTIFIHVPKVAGTSLGEALFESGRTGHFEWNLYRAENPLAFEEYFKFCFVREPVARFLSAYNYLLDGGKSSADRNAGTDLRSYGGVNAFIQDGLKQHDWLRWVHFRPQSDFICDRRGRIMVDFVGRHESFDADCEQVAQRVGMEIRPKQKNQTTVVKATSESLTHTSLTILAKVYRDDFLTFGYPVPTVE